jgi:predicted phosphoribosyltransferase
MTHAVVLGLPRGGIPVAAAIADRFRLDLDVLCVRKLGMPFHGELAMGAVASGGAVVRNEDVLALVRDPEATFERVLAREREELARREHAYRGPSAAALDVQGRTAIVVDDGLATGATMEAAVRALRTLGAARVVVAVPVGAPEACERVAAVADRVVCMHQPANFTAVGQWYRVFDQTSDVEVTQALAAARLRNGGERTP